MVVSGPKQDGPIMFFLWNMVVIQNNHHIQKEEHPFDYGATNNVHPFEEHLLVVTGLNQAVQTAESCSKLLKLSNRLLNSKCRQILLLFLDV